MADCRKCFHFLPPDRLDRITNYYEYEKAETLRFRMGAAFLGWCNRLHKPVTYYVGRCRYYAPRQSENDLKITQFLAAGVEG